MGLSVLQSPKIMDLSGGTDPKTATFITTINVWLKKMLIGIVDIYMDFLFRLEVTLTLLTFIWVLIFLFVFKRPFT